MKKWCLQSFTDIVHKDAGLSNVMNLIWTNPLLRSIYHSLPRKVMKMVESSGFASSRDSDRLFRCGFATDKVGDDKCDEGEFLFLVNVEWNRCHNFCNILSGFFGGSTFYSRPLASPSTNE